MKPKVSVCMLTYNQENWIEQAIMGVLMQKTNFPIELIIGEDCSTDNTAGVIRKLAKQYPDIIKPVFNKDNLGLAKNFTQSLNYCNGKYIAICEGDDWWTDPMKLQKQVDFLEANTNCIICSHNSARFYDQSKLLNENIKYSSNFYFNQDRYLKEWLTQPLTCVFRNFFKDYSLIERDGFFCDVIIFYELLKHGEGYFMSDNMATFRVHEQALSSGLSQRQWIVNHTIMFDHLYKYNSYDIRLQKKSASYFIRLFIYDLKNNNFWNINLRPLKCYSQRSSAIFDRIFTLFFKVPYYLLRYWLFYHLKKR